MLKEGPKLAARVSRMERMGFYDALAILEQNCIQAEYVL